MSYKKFEAADTLENGSKYVVVEYFIADATTDIEDLPGLDEVAFGSMCACLEDGKKYVLRESGEWEVFGDE